MDSSTFLLIMISIYTILLKFVLHSCLISFSPPRTFPPLHQYLASGTSTRTPGFNPCISLSETRMPIFLNKANKLEQIFYFCPFLLYLCVNQTFFQEPQQVTDTSCYLLSTADQQTSNDHRIIATQLALHLFPK